MEYLLGCYKLTCYSNIGELFAGFVLSSKAKADILAIDAEKALSISGVHSFYSVQDLKRLGFKNEFNIALPLKDERVFADGQVTAVGQIIGVVLADSQVSKILK